MRESLDEVDNLRAVKMGEMLEEVDGLSGEFLKLHVFLLKSMLIIMPDLR